MTREDAPHVRPSHTDPVPVTLQSMKTKPELSCGLALACAVIDPAVSAMTWIWHPCDRISNFSPLWPPNGHHSQVQWHFPYWVWPVRTTLCDLGVTSFMYLFETPWNFIKRRIFSWEKFHSMAVRTFSYLHRGSKYLVSPGWRSKEMLKVSELFLVFSSSD